MSKVIGIYTIKNHKNGKIYVGQSICITQRLYRHRLSLKKGTHYNTHLQNSYNRHGHSAFTFQVIEKIEDASNVTKHLNEREDYWIAYYKSLDPQFGYNFVDNSTKINLKRNPVLGKSRGFQNKERFYNHRIISKSENEKGKSALWVLIDSYLQLGYKVKVRSNGLKSNYFIVVFEKGYEDIRYSTHTKTLEYTLIVDGEGNKKKKVAVYEIQPGGSEIIHKEKSIGDMVKYLNITNETELHNCIKKNKNCASNNAATCRGRIFVSEDSYNPEIIYMKRWEYNKQVKASKPKRAKPNVIVQKDLQGNIVRKYERIGLVCEENPTFRKKSVIKVMNLPNRTYKGFTFEYESRPGGIFSHS